MNLHEFYGSYQHRLSSHKQLRIASKEINQVSLVEIIVVFQPLSKVNALKTGIGTLTKKQAS